MNNPNWVIYRNIFALIKQRKYKAISAKLSKEELLSDKSHIIVEAEGNGTTYSFIQLFLNSDSHKAERLRKISKQVRTDKTILIKSSDTKISADTYFDEILESHIMLVDYEKIAKSYGIKFREVDEEELTYNEETFRTSKDELPLIENSAKEVIWHNWKKDQVIETIHTTPANCSVTGGMRRVVETAYTI